MDWPAILALEARTGAVLRSDLLAERYRLSLGTVKRALRRQEDRGFVEHISKRVYINKLAPDFSPRDLVNELRPDSYVSLEWALLEWGISTQSPVAITCVSLSYARTVKTRSVHIIFRAVKENLFCGFTEKKTRYNTYKIAEPEKALLDWIYFRLRDGLPITLDELRFEKINRSRLVSYAKRYPSTVLHALFPVLLEKNFATERV